jgi:hypothetical protein
VQFGRFPFLRLVPEEDAIGHRAQQRLARQVIPAPDRQHGPDAKPSRGGKVIQLRGAEVHERRDEQHLGRLGGNERFDRPCAGNAALEKSQQPIESGRPAEPCAGT